MNFSAEFRKMLSLVSRQEFNTNEPLRIKTLELLNAFNGQLPENITKKDDEKFEEINFDHL